MTGSLVQIKERWREIDQRFVVIQNLQRYLAAAQAGLFPAHKSWTIPFDG
jgi:hypothetical protein